MSEFLNYEILGIISVQMYLICTFITFVILGLISKKKNSDLTKIVCKAFVWPYVVVLMALLGMGALSIGILAIVASIREKRRK